jgi:two-component system sensor histidine kinase UhpB
VDRVQAGQREVRVDPGALSDERFDRLIATFNGMLDRLAAHEEQLRRLPRGILQAQEEERRRVARELHDEAAQALTSLLVRLRLLERSETPEAAREHVQELRRLTAEALDQVRRVALELRPTILDDLGLVAALGWRVDELNEDPSIEASLEVRGVVERLPQEVELVLYRVAQEALANVARHSRARHARVVLSSAAGGITLQVTDDGTGFDPEEAAVSIAEPHGLGLLGIRERLALVSGTLAVQSKPGEGTCLTASVPLPQDAPARGSTSRTVTGQRFGPDLHHRVRSDGARLPWKGATEHG